jgi:UDP-MurNAc hydroxylase
MKITFIKSSTVIIESGGVKVLCDPWMTDGIYYGSWYHYPPMEFKPSDYFDVDYIYISHIHPDHMDKYTLEQFPKTIPILIHDYQEKYLYQLIKSLGFEQVIEVAHKSAYKLSDDFSIEILAADNCDPAACAKFFGCRMSKPYMKTLQIDSLAAFHGEGYTVVNTNDCQYELAHKVCDYLVDKYKKIDMVMVGYSSATAYPQCFESLSTERKVSEKYRIRDQFLHKAVSYVKHLKAPYFLPFAGQYVLGGKLHNLNKYRSPPYVEELPRLFPPILKELSVDATMLRLNSGAYFDLASKNVSAPFVNDDPVERQNYLDNVISKNKFLYDTVYYIPPKDRVDLFDQLAVSYDKMLHFQNEYGYHSDWNVYIDAGMDFLYRIPFNGQGISRVKHGSEELPFVRIKLDYCLLKMILEKKAHWNNAEIGSHLIFYRDPEQYEVGVFRFLSFLHT